MNIPSEAMKKRLMVLFGIDFVSGSLRIGQIETGGSGDVRRNNFLINRKKIALTFFGCIAI